MEKTMDLNKALDRVRKLIAKAEGTDNPIEAEIFRAGADKIMIDYAIEEAQVRAAAPVGQRAVPGIIWVEQGGVCALSGDLGSMMAIVALYCRCMTRTYDRYSSASRCWETKVYGFESDLRYFELMYTTLRLPMLGALRPRIDPAESFEENCYRLHNAGYNWLEIAEMYGWRKVEHTHRFRKGELTFAEQRDLGDRHPEMKSMKIPYWHEKDDVVVPSTTIGPRIKRAYWKIANARGEKHLSIR